MLKRLIEWIRKLLGFSSDTPTPAPTPTTNSTPAASVPSVSLDEWLNSLPASTRAHIPRGKEREYRDRMTATQGAVESAAGFDLGAGDGRVKVNPVQADQPYTFTFTVRPGARKVALSVFGAPGTFFDNLTDSVDGAGEQTRVAGVKNDRDVTGLTPGTHTYTVSVDGSGPLGVQLWQG